MNFLLPFSTFSFFIVFFGSALAFSNLQQHAEILDNADLISQKLYTEAQKILTDYHNPNHYAVPKHKASKKKRLRNIKYTQIREIR